jgi:hypothetical protein
MDKDYVEKLFQWAHLPDNLKAVSRPFHALALLIIEHAPMNPERTVALRKLLEAKDATVRAHVIGATGDTRHAAEVRQEPKDHLVKHQDRDQGR